MKNLKFTFLGVCLILTGCVTESVKLKPGHPIKTDGSFVSRTFMQDGNKVGIEDLFSQLKENKETNASASKGEMWYYGAFAPAAVGGYLIGYNLFSKSDSKIDGLSVSAVLVGTAMIAAYYADQYLMESVDIYNRKVPKKAATIYSIRPAVVLVNNQSEQTHSSFVPAAGLLISF